MSKPPEMLAGLPFIEARERLRQIRHLDVRRGFFSQWHGASAREDARLFQALLSDHLIESMSEERGTYRLSSHGLAMAQKSLRRMTYATVRAMETRVLAVVVAMAAEPAFSIEVTRLAVFGSAAAAEPAEDYGDLDLTFEMKEKPQYASWETAFDAFNLAFEERSDQSAWGIVSPDTEIPYQIRKRARCRQGLSFHRWKEIEHLGCARRVIYDRDAGGVLSPPTFICAENS